MKEMLKRAAGRAAAWFWPRKDIIFVCLLLAWLAYALVSAVRLVSEFELLRFEFVIKASGNTNHND